LIGTPYTYIFSIDAAFIFLILKNWRRICQVIRGFVFILNIFRAELVMRPLLLISDILRSAHIYYLITMLMIFNLRHRPSRNNYLILSSCNYSSSPYWKHRLGYPWEG